MTLGRGSKGLYFTNYFIKNLGDYKYPRNGEILQESAVLSLDRQGSLAHQKCNMAGLLLNCAHCTKGAQKGGKGNFFEICTNV